MKRGEPFITITLTHEVADGRMTVETLAAELGVWPDDVRTVMETLDTPELSDEVAADVRLILNPHCERTVPSLYGFAV